ncbi:MAG TPA: adenylate/guanylate cyclase domain-containing protein, partial [Blastocatellia bacterium]|nr:adenylate/guanylate cyclase domain-containing protein [Blastocatellia bacterium]
DQWTNDFLQLSLLWHFGFWRLKQLREHHNLSPRAIMPPGSYKSVAVLMADLCSFSSFVRDTRDDEVVRHCLTMFYSKARYEILNTGGMLYQFVGDEVIGLYGLPDRAAGYIESALDCAQALVDLGNSVSNEWQRQIDRVQEACGVHIGMSLADIQVVSMQPFGRAHIGAIGDGINMAARLLAQAGPSEIVVSNGFYQGLSQTSQADFEESPPIDARNIGRIKAWRSVCKRC